MLFFFNPFFLSFEFLFCCSEFFILDLVKKNMYKDEMVGVRVIV